MKEIEIRSLDFNVDKAKDDSYLVQGYIASNSTSHILGKTEKGKWREVIPPGVFNEALSKARRIGQDIDFLVDHDNKKILASTSNESLFLEEDETGLYISAKISPTTWGKDLFVLVKDGIIKGLSFGMKVVRDTWTRTSDGLPLRTILEIDLFEISALKVPAYPTTLLEARGLEVIDVEIPNEIENRNLGGNDMNNEKSEYEITPTQFYEGMVLIADKLDLIIQRLDESIQQKALKEVEEAKDILAQTKAVVEANAETVRNSEIIKEVETIKESEASKEEKRSLEEATEVDAEQAEDTQPEVVTGETEDVVEEVTEEVIEETTEETEETTDEVVETEAEPELEEEETNNETEDEEPVVVDYKKEISEYRSLLESLKMEVPEIE